ncbi:MAG: OmpA family protein [Saprospiraceae bacterium]|nr:OmpA family protein [Saprospiraceae bacterium]MBK8485327.1 OmpA family protein [Saprospiraceae bacterium]MBK9222546.1 OmpA family protein [Saprospiraceae bacterium]MBK9720421.1 OmpA family protein [Saprospiraceae bacterium]MBK9727391.1 OmpA family protein [Saprospiraceae bacterium]
MLNQKELLNFFCKSRNYFYTALFICLLSTIHAQNSNDIFLQNGSFEGSPQCCQAPNGWVDCGHKGETPPDIQPALGNGNTPLFSVTKIAFQGNTYLGMVVRENETYERVAQRLIKPLLKGKCYSFSIYLCRSDTYLSASNKDKPSDLKQFTEPVILRIWGGEAYCNQKQLLAESPLVDNTDWKKFEFEFEPKYDLNYLELEAFYKTPVLFPYNGNILLDNASHLSIIPCPADSSYSKYKKDKERNKQKNTVIVSKPKENQKPKTPATDVANSGKKPKERILKYLDNTKVTVGQVFKIEKLYFETDSATFKVESYAVLDELYDYLNKNTKIRVEIGGHTNNKCAEKYCERLSLLRAEAVKLYFVEKGIDPKRMLCKGYGGKNPVASNSTKDGRQLNQRVEIKILSIAG